MPTTISLASGMSAATNFTPAFWRPSRKCASRERRSSLAMTSVEPAELQGSLQLGTVRVAFAALDLDALADQLPLAPIEEVGDRLALGLQAKAAVALTLGRNPQVRDELALSHVVLTPVI